MGALLLLGACARGPRETAGRPAQPIVFPPPPATARVQFLGSLFSTRDLPSRRSRWADFVLGEEPAQYPLVKPYAATLVGTRLYVCDTVLNTVLVYDLLHGGAHRLAGDHGLGKIQEPNAIAIGPDGKFYVADKKRHGVIVYGADEEYLAAWGRPDQVDPVAVAATDKVLYVCDIKDHEIEVWDAATGAYLRSIGKRGTAPGEFYIPDQIRLDREGNIYVTDTGNFRVQKLSPEGQPLQQIGGFGLGLGQFAWPKGMDVDAQGRLFVADSRFCNVQIFNPAGRLLLFFGGPGPEAGNLDLPAGLTIVPWPGDIPWLTQRLAPGFVPDELVMVVSQIGAVAVNFFAVAREEGVQ